MSGSWSLKDAKARFGEVVFKAQTEGVQRVTVRGREAVAVISVSELDRLVRARPAPPLLKFMQGLRLHELDLQRASDTGRDMDL